MLVKYVRGITYFVEKMMHLIHDQRDQNCEIVLFSEITYDMVMVCEFEQTQVPPISHVLHLLCLATCFVHTFNCGLKVCVPSVPICSCES